MNENREVEPSGCLTMILVFMATAMWGIVSAIERLTDAVQALGGAQ